MKNNFPSRIGSFVEVPVAGQNVKAYVPPPLPPLPSVDIIRLLPSLLKAQHALGQLNGMTFDVIDKELFLYMYVRKEAVLSSQIEGTQSTLSDLLRFESEAQSGHPFDDVREASNYVDALMYGVDRLSTLPLSLRLIREMHVRLLRGSRGSHQNPGVFRTSQNWIGGAAHPGNAMFVPPPVTALSQCLSDWEMFLHEEVSALPDLIKIGLLHVQFETIHPFLDGNGRIGRLLIALFLSAKGVLREPILYLSLYFKTHRNEYYRLLQSVRETGNWEEWLEFFLIGVSETANQAHQAAISIKNLFERDHSLISAGVKNRKMGSSAFRVHDFLREKPFVTATGLVKQTGLSMPTVNSVLSDMEALGIVTEITGRKRERVFCYQGYMELLNEGTNPLTL